MHKQQKQVMDSFVRVRAFLEANPSPGPLPYGAALEMFDDALRRAREYAGEQISGRQLSRVELRRQWELHERLLDEHMRPIVTIARSQIEPGSDVGIPAGFRMPMDGLGVTKMLQAADGMIESARACEALFVANGMPEDFLARFSHARDELEGAMRKRATMIGIHIAARAGLRVQLHRCRLAVDRLDAIVRASFRGDEVVLKTWRTTKRVHHLPGGTGARIESEVAPEVVTQVVPTVVPTAGPAVERIALMAA